MSECYDAWKKWMAEPVPFGLGPLKHAREAEIELDPTIAKIDVARSAFIGGWQAHATLAAIPAEVQRGLYTASKTLHAHVWRAMRQDGWPIVSTWIDEAGIGETADFSDLWRRCIAEAKHAEAVLLYREQGEVLKGAFIEAGAALANGTPVHTVGCGEFSFVNHPLVTQHASLAEALAILRKLKDAEPAPQPARDLKPYRGE